MRVGKDLEKFRKRLGRRAKFETLFGSGAELATLTVIVFTASRSRADLLFLLGKCD